MPWYTYHDTTSGALQGHGSDAPQVIAGCTRLEHTDRMDQANTWDAPTRTWVPRPVVTPESRAESFTSAEGTATADRTFARALARVLGMLPLPWQGTFLTTVQAMPEWSSLSVAERRAVRFVGRLERISG